MDLKPLPIAPRLPTLIFLNGPAGSGKSTLAEHLVARHPHDVTQYHHASPLWSMIDCLTSNDGESEEDFWKDYNDPAIKDSPVSFVGPRIPDHILTYREALISLGHWSRTTFGPWVLAHLAVAATREYLTSQFSTVVFPACRTPEDVELLAAVAGAQNCLLVRIIRDGYSFEHDLGDYIPKNSFNVPTIELYNRGTLEEFLASADSLLQVNS